MNAETMAAIMSEANESIASLNREIFPDFDYRERDRAGVAAVVGVIEGESLWLASIADCWCVGAWDSFWTGPIRRPMIRRSS
jgi:hypothetical protein